VAQAAGLEIAAPEGGRTWLPFFLGGTEEWAEVRTSAVIAEAFGLEAEPLRVVRVPDGSFEVAAPAAAARRFPCELLRNQLRLPSCPDDVTSPPVRPGGFTFRGKGEGHGAGLDLTLAAAAAAEGADARTLLAHAWPELHVVPSPPSPR
jgi:hypothetical protein